MFKFLESILRFSRVQYNCKVEHEQLTRSENLCSKILSWKLFLWCWSKHSKCLWKKQTYTPPSKPKKPYPTPQKTEYTPPPKKDSHPPKKKSSLKKQINLWDYWIFALLSNSREIIHKNNNRRATDRQNPIPLSHQLLKLHQAWKLVYAKP